MTSPKDFFSTSNTNGEIGIQNTDAFIVTI